MRAAASCAGFFHRIGDQFVDRDIFVPDAVDEAAVGTVFKQAAHQIGQQRLMRAHRRIDAARPVQLVRPHHLLIQRLTHAVQALEFIAAKGEIRPGHGVNGGQRVGIVGGKLREHRIARAEQFGGAGKVRHIGVQLARKHREIAEAIHLGALDLAVPISAFHQPHHDPPAAAAGQIDQPVDHQRAALAIGLYHETQAVPALQHRRQRQRFQQIERQFQPVGFFGIDVEADAIALGKLGQRRHARQ